MGYDADLTQEDRDQPSNLLLTDFTPNKYPLMTASKTFSDVKIYENKQTYLEK